MYAFTLVWIGQLVSLTGSEMTRFALVFWAWQETGSATISTTSTTLLWQAPGQHAEKPHRAYLGSTWAARAVCYNIVWCANRYEAMQ